MAFQLTSSQRVPVAVDFTDKKGNPAPVDGIPEWLVDNPAVLALSPAADGRSCVVAAVGPLGTARVSMVADADMTTGTRQIVGVLDFEIVAGDAFLVTLTPGTPEEQPDE